MKYILFIFLLASCTKENCEPPEFTNSGNVVYFKVPGTYYIEVQGLDNPYRGVLKVEGTSQRVEGANWKVRVKSECSDYSQWQNKQ